MVNGIDERSHNFRAFDAAFGGDSAVPGSTVVGVPENYALPGKRGRASGPTIRLRNWYRARKAAAFARNTRGSDSFSRARGGRAERWSVARCRGESRMQYGRKLARTASQARLFDRISLGGVAGGTIYFYMRLYGHICHRDIHTSFQFTSIKRDR